MGESNVFTASLLRDSVKRYCAEKQLTYREFAARAGVEETVIEHMISGEDIPDLDEMRKIIARVMKCELAWLLQKG